MFRVKLNLWSSKAEQDVACEDLGADRFGDWAEEQSHVDARLTREDMCQTFQEKFPKCSGTVNQKIA